MKKTLKNVSNLGRKDAQIFNVGLNSTSKEQVLRFLRYRISKAEKFFIITPNPEILFEAEQDQKYAQILNSADLSIPDGVGLFFATKVLKQPSLKIIKGREMFEEIIKLANKKKWRVFLLGGNRDESKVAVDKLSLNYKGVKFAFSAGPQLDFEANPASEEEKRIEEETVKKINEFKPDILFVGFGAPKQEKWAHKWFSRLSVGGIMVVGGTFRYVSGQAKLPPKWMEEKGLEWLWRVLIEPRRIGRIFRAVIVFPLKVIFKST